MPISRTTFLRSTLLLMLIGIGALVAVVATTIWLVSHTQDYFDSVVTLRKSRAALVELRSQLQDAETGQRGYLLTLDEAYLAPFLRAKEAVPAQFALVEQRLAGRDASQLAKLKPVIATKMGELEETINLARAGQRDKALDMVRTDLGKTAMDEARGILAQIIEGTDQLLNDRVEEQNRSAAALWWVVVVAGIVILAVTLLGGLTISAYMRELAAARREVEDLNMGLEGRVRERTQELARANEEIQRFAYIVTHDLRAPLVNIMGFTSELEASLAPVKAYISHLDPPPIDPAFREAKQAADEDLPEALGFIRSSTRKMDGLINAILKLSREGRRVLKPETIDLRNLAEHASRTVTHQVAEADGAFDLDIKVGPIVSDRLALEQIVGNLLDNAVKYRRKDVPLHIAVRARRGDRARVVVDIEDNGRGIAAQDHERVFELFRRSGAQDQAGEGIGLAHVRTLVRNIGGEISLTSELGKGTTFSIVLPQDMRTVVGSIAA
ncbi:CHASE3 domain-containing protein [Ancylobacter sp. 6x-1]|uniref:histidine kinase n=1 Tax=Ancylobacter crimeensis TaxID=2579147 RepID=A0ABT0D773_9HYPH|nr:CHASE3 domain-containing protein [Ancylobacter crimeensis]MCK0195807.1 CHASE3 domain-containing protein [Ancylobacter crimeensis]